MDDDADTVARLERRTVLAGFEAPGAAGDELVRGALGHPDPRVRVRALGAAARRGLYGEAERLTALRDESPLVRRRACELEATLPSSRRVLDCLAACLQDPDAHVVVRAAVALGEAGRDGAVAVEQLVEVARAHGDARCREAAVAALGAVGDERGRSAVLAALSDRPAVRRRAVAALAAFEGDDVDAALSAASGDRDWQVREIADALRRDEPGEDTP